MQITFILTLFLFFFASGINATKHLYRGGNASTPVNKIREQDFGKADADGNHHPGPAGHPQGLSTFADPNHLPVNTKHVHVTTPQKAQDAGFHVHDDQRANTHHTIAVSGPHPAATLQQDLHNIGWTKMNRDQAISHHAEHNTKRSLPEEHDSRPMNRVRMVHEAVQASKRAELEKLD
ncbi:hypothetical protein FRC17_010728 [Serendipita sp. 399]|nr:hypothetical protein FRC17_010728 [Serendipita sp. 399]